MRGSVTFLPPSEICEADRAELLIVSFVVAVNPSGSLNTTPPKDSTELGEYVRIRSVVVPSASFWTAVIVKEGASGRNWS
ncbi:hypothetical protein C6370_08010 [Bacillus atrophaeus]|nr:hypothetical protein C6W22_10345 [Bacillus atrophaeus]PSA94942.1 hypothetical protein C6370_08010 [Bacillus atrophaeus]